MAEMFWRPQRRPTPSNGTRSGSGQAFSGAAVELGRRLGGDAAIPTRDGVALLPLEMLARHALVLGASGSGKTETLLRIAHQVAAVSDWRVFYVDGKGDEQTLARFYALMQLAGRGPRAFPRERYDGWRGDPAEVANRLLELIDFAIDGPGAYYRDQAVNVIRLACDTPQGPPRSSGELLGRLRLGQLRGLYAGHPYADQVDCYTERQVDEVRARYQAFFGAVRGRLDGAWAFEDADSGYLLLDGIRLKHEAGNLARFLVEDFCQYAVARKPSGQRALLIVDEFSAIAKSGSSLVDAIERIRGAGAAVVLAPQALEGMGGQEAAARIVGSTNLKILHAIPSPEEIAKVAGTRLVLESSLQHDQGEPTGMGSARSQHAFKVDPNEVRRLPVGSCFVITQGAATKVRVNQAPATAEPDLPEPEPDPTPRPAAKPTTAPLAP